jgi:hypothetical protein
MKTLAFLFLMLVCTISCTAIWGNFVDGELYNCTDAIPFGFSHPGDWIHGNYITVPRIDPSDSMDKSDSIKAGWSVPKLWLLWWSFVAASVAISASLTYLIYRLRKSKAAQMILP